MIVPRRGLKWMADIGQTVVQGLQGISSEQKNTGLHDGPGRTELRAKLSPGRDLRTSRVDSHDSSI